MCYHERIRSLPPRRIVLGKHLASLCDRGQFSNCGFGAALADTPMTNNTTATNRLFAGFPLDLLATYTELSVTGFIFPNGCVADRFLPVEHRRRLLVPRRQSRDITDCASVFERSGPFALHHAFDDDVLQIEFFELLSLGL